MSTDKLGKSSRIAERLRKLVDEAFGGKAAGLSRATGLSSGAVSEYLSGKIEPSFERLARIVEHTPVNAQWLLTGEGPMLRGQGDEPGMGSTEGVLELPELQVKVSAGDGALVLVEEEVGRFPIGEAYFRKMVGVDPKQAVMVGVEGDSMLPTLMPNDLVMVNIAKPQKIVDGLWVVRLGSSTFVKRVQVLPGNVLRVSSDNPAYREFEMDMNEEQPDFELVGRVVWAPRLF